MYKEQKNMKTEVLFRQKLMRLEWSSQRSTSKSLCSETTTDLLTTFKSSYQSDQKVMKNYEITKILKFRFWKSNCKLLELCLHQQTVLKRSRRMVDTKRKIKGRNTMIEVTDS